jgi:sugar O-acyltransferase (sialic acid O-acetyltransferase NeuD family)
MKPLLLIGCGGHARSLIDLIESTCQWHIHGLVGFPEQVGSSVLGYPVIGINADLYSLREACPAAVLAIGQLPDPAPRQRLAAQLEQLGFHCPVLISSQAVVSRHAQLGPGTTVGHGAIVNAAAVVGAHCILNSGALIEHDVQIGDHCHISTGALVNGDVRVGSGSFIGSGAMIREGLELPDQTVIGAGKRVMGWPLRDKL